MSSREETLPLPQPAAVPGALYKFTVGSADEAARLIRERLGENARVLSVRNVEAAGLGRLWKKPMLEVVAQITGAAEAIQPAPAISGAHASYAAQPAFVAPQLPETPAAAATSAHSSVTPSRSGYGSGGPTAPARFPARADTLPALLRRAGFSETLLTRLEGLPAWQELATAPLHRGLVDTGRLLRSLASRRTAAPALTRAAFIGTAGVGRTTALCKWLSTEVFRRGRMGHVVTAEFDRPYSPGPLPVFCEALGVPVAHFPASTLPATDGGFVYFDLPGISLRDPNENRAMARFLDGERIQQRVLVLNAAYDHAALRAAYAAGRELGATHLVFTHLDEVPQWGRLWDYLLDGALHPLFLATGPSLTGDCETDVTDALARRTLPGTGCTTFDDTAIADDPNAPSADDWADGVPPTTAHPASRTRHSAA